MTAHTRDRQVTQWQLDSLASIEWTCEGRMCVLASASLAMLAIGRQWQLQNQQQFEESKSLVK